MGASKIKSVAAGSITAAFAILGYAVFTLLSGNFHTVVAGQLYRSAQVSPERLATYRHLFAIRTVVNLRGPNAGTDWYDKEAAAARALGMVQIDFSMSSRRELSSAQAAALVDALKNAPKPILIHCNGGADRSGLAAALFMASVLGKDDETAERELSIFYGHIGIPFLSKAYAMDRTFEDLEPWLVNYRNSVATQQNSTLLKH